MVHIAVSKLVAELSAAAPAQNPVASCKTTRIREKKMHKHLADQVMKLILFFHTQKLVEKGCLWAGM